VIRGEGSSALECSSLLMSDRLPDIIAKHTHKKPMMVFCFTRRSCISTAKLLANLWATRAPQDRLWPGPTFRMAVQDPDLKGRRRVADVIGEILKLFRHIDVGRRISPCWT
jgi:hypothetical protein